MCDRQITKNLHIILNMYFSEILLLIRCKKTKITIHYYYQSYWNTLKSICYCSLFQGKYVDVRLINEVIYDKVLVIVLKNNTKKSITNLQYRIHLKNTPDEAGIH